MSTQRVLSLSAIFLSASFALNLLVSMGEANAGEKVACIDLETGEYLDGSNVTSSEAGAGIKCGCKTPEVAGCTVAFMKGSCEARGTNLNPECKGKCYYQVVCIDRSNDMEASIECAEVKPPTPTPTPTPQPIR